jgi:bifunctional DNase/RNase
MEKVLLEITGIEYSQTHSGSYVLHLKEIHGKRHMPIVIGSFEAQAIAVELEKMSPNRPMTHDLFKPILDVFHIAVKEVIIHEFREGLFIAKITLIGEDGIPTDIDSRSSDAVAIAVRFNAPLFVTEEIMNEAGIKEEQKEEGEEEIPGEAEERAAGLLDPHVLLDEMQSALNDAINNENYEEAARLRDEISRMKRRS